MWIIVESDDKVQKFLAVEAFKKVYSGHDFSTSIALAYGMNCHGAKLSWMTENP